MASDLVKARKEILIILYHLIRDKFNHNNSTQSKDQRQNKVSDFFNIQYGKLIPLVLHSNLCRHHKREINDEEEKSTNSRLPPSENYAVEVNNQVPIKMSWIR